MEGHNYVICRLTKLIEYKCHCLELAFLGKFEELSSRYDRDVKYMKEILKLKFEKTNRHIDESVFTVLNKGHRFECDLEKIYKKLLTLFAQPNQQNIAKCLFLKDQKPCNALDVTQYIPPECKCIEDVIPCNYENRKNQRCCCLSEKKVESSSRKVESIDKNDQIDFKFLTPMQRRRLLSKKPATSIGKDQSPIEISSCNAIIIYMPAIEMIGFHNLLPGPITLQNDGSTIVLNIRKLTPNELKLSEFVPYISGGKLVGQYEFEELHFHWGSKNYFGSEHIIDDISYAMEMHIKFKNKKYKHFNEALGHADGLSVMAVFYRISEYDGPEIEIIAENLEKIVNVGDIVELDKTFSLSSLFGNINMDRFYTYKGSITRPPYSEIVTWIVFPEPLQISISQVCTLYTNKNNDTNDTNDAELISQIEKFRQLSSREKGTRLSDNFREVQPLGNRRVFLREGSNQIRREDFDNIHHSKWQWYN